MYFVHILQCFSKDQSPFLSQISIQRFVQSGFREGVTETYDSPHSRILLLHRSEREQRGWSVQSPLSRRQAVHPDCGRRESPPRGGVSRVGRLWRF